MNRFVGAFQDCRLRDIACIVAPKQLAVKGLLALVALTTLAMPTRSFADSRTGGNGASTHVDFRIVIPAIIRVTMVTQPENIVIEDRHIADGYIDLDAVTAVRLTNNSRGGYQLAAQYDAQLLSSVEIRVASQKLTASAGSGSMHVASGLAIEKMIPISYRLHLAQGVQTGQYRWPVALSFSLAVA